MLNLFKTRFILNHIFLCIFRGPIAEFFEKKIMFRRMFRQRNVKKTSRELPPIPKPDDWSAGEEGPDKTYHIYEEIPDKASDFQQKLQDLRICDDRTIPPPPPAPCGISGSPNATHQSSFTIPSWKNGPCSPVPMAEDEARVQRLRRVCQIQYKDYLIDPEKARLSEQSPSQQRSEHHPGFKKMSTSLDNSRLGSDSRDSSFDGRHQPFLMDPRTQDKSNSVADLPTDKSDLVRSCTEAIRRNSEDAPQLTKHLTFTLAVPSSSGCRSKLPPGPAGGPKKLVHFKEHIGNRRNPATIGATAGRFSSGSLQSPRHRKKIDGDDSDVFWGPKDSGMRLVRTIDKKSYMLPRDPSERTKQLLQPDALDREDTDSSENCYEYDVSGLSGSSDCSSTGYCNYDSYLKNVEKNFQHCQQVLNIVRHRSDSESKKSQSEENLDCVSLTTVSSLSHSSSMSTLASYGDASDEGESHSDTDYEVINDACNRIHQENKLSLSCTGFERSRQMSSGRGRKPPSARARSLVTRSERRAELPLAKEEFKIPDMRTRHSSGRGHSRKSARSGGVPAGAPVAPTPVVTAAAAYNNRAGNNRLLNDLIRLNFEQQWKHL